MKKPLDGKAVAPTKIGNAKLVFDIVADMNDWVSEDWIFTLIDPKQLVANSRSRNVTEYQQIKNAINFLVHSGRMIRRRRKYKIASFEEFDARQRELAAQGSGNALKEYFSEPAPFKGRSVRDQLELSPDLLSDCPVNKNAANENVVTQSVDGTGGIDGASLAYGFFSGIIVGAAIAVLIGAM